MTPFTMFGDQMTGALARHKQLVTNWRNSNERRFEAKVDDEKKSGQLFLYDVIGGDYFGEGLTAMRFEQALAELGDVTEITVHINSPGGLVSDGMAMYNALLRHPAKIITNVVGMAASAATLILEAGDERRMGETTKAMIHNALALTIGNQFDHRKTADILGKYDDTIALLYAKRSGRRNETWRKLMDDETYFTAAEALDHRLIDAIVPAKGTGDKAENKIDLGNIGYAKAPEAKDESPVAAAPPEEGEEDDDGDDSADVLAQAPTTTETPPAPAVPVDGTPTTQPESTTVSTDQPVDKKHSAEAVKARLRVLELDAA